jgi:hypothetical protein
MPASWAAVRIAQGTDRWEYQWYFFSAASISSRSAAIQSVPRCSYSAVAGRVSASSCQSCCEYRVSANCDSESSITTMWPIPAAVAPLPKVSRSTSATRSPRCAHARAHAAPTMPPPAMAKSKTRSELIPQLRREPEIHCGMDLRAERSTTTQRLHELRMLYAE